MPAARHRLDLLFVAAAPDRSVDAAAFNTLEAGWRAEGLIATSGPGAGPQRDALLPGGFARLWLDLAPDGALFANQLGGFRPRCPDSGAPLARPFAAAMEAWRAGGPRSLACPCGRVHPLEALDFEPPAAFARGAVIFSDVRSVEPTRRCLEAIRALLGPHRLLLRRPV